MRLRHRIQAELERIAIPNLTTYWAAVQATCVVLIVAQPDFAMRLVLDTRAMTGNGEWWRLVSFLFMPIDASPVFSVFMIYLFWLMGSALEYNWGKVRYNQYVLLGALMNIGAAFIPMAAGQQGFGTNRYLMESIFLAFAIHYPDFVVRLFFVLPVKVKWLAAFTLFLLAGECLVGDWVGRALILASFANFVLFFWRDIVSTLRMSGKILSRQAKRSMTVESESLHRCCVCGATERTAPSLEFRYCGACGGKCYCLEHLRAHTCDSAAAKA